MYYNRDDYLNEQEAIADGLFAIAHAIKLLGNADASMPMGAIEALGKTLKEGLETIAEQLEQLKDP